VAEVRTITAAEVPAHIVAHIGGFYEVVREGAVAYYTPLVQPDRTWDAFDGADIVGTADSFATQLTVPGPVTLPVAAVSGVTVVATHRRQGLLRQLMAAQLASITEPQAVLIAAEAPIYGRFGYGPAIETVDLHIDARRAGFVDPPAPGRVRRCTPAELVADAPAIHTRWCGGQAGELARRVPRWWDRHYLDRPPGWTPDPGTEFHVVTRDAGGVADGYATYRVLVAWARRSPDCTVFVDELVATSDDAYRALWHHCTTIDWVTRVEAGRRPVVEALPSLLVDRRAVSQETRADFVWARLLDVVTCLGARRYRVADRMVLEVTDDFGGYAAGRYVIEGGADGAVCSPTSEAPNLTVTVADLSAAYLGGTALRLAAVAGRVGEHRPGAVAAFDRMFLTDVLPFCSTNF